MFRIEKNVLTLLRRTKKVLFYKKKKYIWSVNNPNFEFKN